jgi:AcrR family transcriptional regulator
MAARPRQISDDEILEAARECLFEHGVSVSAQVIADKAGVSQPALFKRFGTKEELVLRALAPPEKIPVLEWIATVPKPGPFRPQLRELLENIWETLQWILPRIALLMASPFSPEKLFSRYETPPPLRLIIAIREFMERAKQNGQIRQDADSEALALSALGLLQGRAFFRFMLRSQGSADDAFYIEAAVDLICRGVLPKEDAS